jgi:hypothetical protein
MISLNYRSNTFDFMYVFHFIRRTKHTNSYTKITFSSDLSYIMYNDLQRRNKSNQIKSNYTVDEYFNR